MSNNETNESDRKIDEDYVDLGNESKPLESVLLKEGMYVS